MKTVHIQKVCFNCGGKGIKERTTYIKNSLTTIYYPSKRECPVCDGTGVEDEFVECLEVVEVI